MALKSKYSIPNEHNYSKSSKQRNVKLDKNKDGPNKINLPDAKPKKTFTMVSKKLKIPILQSLIKENESLFGILKTQKDLIALPENWFCDVSKNSLQLPISVTFFTLNNLCFTTKRYLEKQVVINRDSDITFVVNGKKLIPSELGLKEYIKPLDINSLQNAIQEFNSINICQGMSKQNIKLAKLRVFESNDRWWHPNCANMPAKKSFLCYSCKILNSIVLKVVGKQRNHQQKPLPIDNFIPRVKKSNIINQNQNPNPNQNQNQIKRKTPAEARPVTVEAKTVTVEAKTVTVEAKTVTAKARTVATKARTVTAEARTVTAEARTVTAEARTVTAEARTVTAKVETTETKKRKIQARVQKTPAKVETTETKKRKIQARVQKTPAKVRIISKTIPIYEHGSEPETVKKAYRNNCMKVNCLCMNESKNSHSTAVV